MKIITRCFECGPKEEAALLEVGNENLHQVTCDKGHKHTLVIAQHKHEILFEIATQAIVDGYYREAISSYSSSLERYFEFFIKVISIEWPLGVFGKAWEQVTSQSERQLGGYIFTYTHIYHSPPETLPQHLIKLRNNVIHKGLIPDREHTINFGEVVAKIISKGCDLLRTTKKGSLNEFIRRALYPNDNSNYPMKILSTYLNCLHESKLPPLKEYIKSVSTHNISRF